MQNSIRWAKCKKIVLKRKWLSLLIVVVLLVIIGCLKNYIEHYIEVYPLLSLQEEIDEKVGDNYKISELDTVNKKICTCIVRCSLETIESDTFVDDCYQIRNLMEDYIEKNPDKFILKFNRNEEPDGFGLLICEDTPFDEARKGQEISFFNYNSALVSGAKEIIYYDGLKDMTTLDRSDRIERKIVDFVGYKEITRMNLSEADWNVTELLSDLKLLIEKTDVKEICLSGRSDKVNWDKIKSEVEAEGVRLTLFM